MRFSLKSRVISQLVIAGTAVCLASATALAQESQMQAQETAALDRVGPWKLINTAIFVALLGWFLAKNAPRFFNARSSDIQKAIKDATGLKIEADFRYSDIDKKMARLPEEVNKLREQAETEMQREHQRIQQQTATEIEHMQTGALNEIEALRQEAADRLQLHTAQLALGLAERRLQDRFAQSGPQDSLGDFIRLVDGRQN